MRGESGDIGAGLSRSRAEAAEGVKMFHGSRGLRVDELHPDWRFSVFVCVCVSVCVAYATSHGHQGLSHWIGRLG